MFEDKEYIKNIVGMRDDDQIVIPLYIQIYGQKYSLLELDTIKKRFSRSAFKVGYATADALFMNNSFPVNRIGEFDLVNTFTEYDESMERQIRYTVFESGDVDVKEDDKLGEEIHMYFECLFNNVRERVDAHFKSLIEQESVPLIPRHIPVADEEDEDIPYLSADDEDDEYVEEDALEDLRKEVAEYSQDDDSETISNDYISEGIEMGDGEVDVLGNEVNDDYLSEGDEYPRVTGEGILGKETVDFINGEGKYSDDNDYSTDFDVF